MSTLYHERARIASLTRSRDPNDPELIAARQNLTALRLQQYVIDAAPKLRAEQRQQLAELLTAASPC
jgi:hypothetical protein